MQAPVEDEEDKSGIFEYSGWVASYAGELSGKVLQKLNATCTCSFGQKNT
ncbi:hypothetical protein [Pedobacter mendelii]|uniref:Uncharacterized protein n=1 Tax=Pedobacter mendelii TaxID=1908240 RepID=A0ABQ2BBF9_9SPHI|nr:hypothetical protein [Pedobacter mendelii]GGI22251.1 hypothetical protein GCM10008119_01710 [Pedobacter mendelii]